MINVIVSIIVDHGDHHSLILPVNALKIAYVQQICLFFQAIAHKITYAYYYCLFPGNCP